VWRLTIAEQFQQMQADLAREKAAMNRAWAKREKQIETIVSNTAKLTGELQALCGPSLPNYLNLRCQGMSWTRQRDSKLPALR